MGRFDEAEQLFGRALSLKPDFEIPLVHLANTYVREGRYRDAIRTYRRYVDRAPSSVERLRGLTSLSVIHDRLGQHVEAHALGERAIEGNDLIPWTLVLRAFDRNDRALIDRARRELEQIVVANRGTAGSSRWRLASLSTIALKTGRTDEAIAYARAAMREPATIWHLEDYETCLADTLAAAGRPADAIPEYERVLRLNPNHALARYGLAHAYDAAGRPSSAAHQYATFLEVWRHADRDLPEVIAARRRLAAD
jgi:tetratricopeptide (TPR) repeat protein